MVVRSALAICAALFSLGISSHSAAQDAAETAQILSGVSQPQARSVRRLGSTISQSMNAASDAVRSGQATRHSAGRRRSHAAAPSYAIPENADLLEGTDAPTYKVGNGASIRVSGRLIQTPETACVKDCPESRAP